MVKGLSWLFIYARPPSLDIGFIVCNKPKTNWDRLKDFWHVIKDFITIANAIVTSVLALMVYNYTTANSDLKVSFSPIDAPEHAVMLLPNSRKGFDPTSRDDAYVTPSTTKRYEINIWNEGKIKAEDVVVKIQLKKPFVICLIAFDEKLKPKGSWEMKYDEATYESCEIQLGFIGSKGQGDRIKLILVYSYPRSLDLDMGTKLKESEALTVMIKSSSQRKTVEEKYDLDYWES